MFKSKIIILILSLFNCFLINSKIKNILMLGSSEHEKKELSRNIYSKNYKFMFQDIENEDGSLFKGKDIKELIEYLTQKYKKENLDGVLSTQDYIGNICATILAKELNLAGPSIKSVLDCQHKYYSRKMQQKHVPEAVPKFGIIDPKSLDSSFKKLAFEFPFFIKPIKAYFSFGASKIFSLEELRKKMLHIIPGKSFLQHLNYALKKYTNHKLTADYLLAEEILKGRQLTFEGFIQNGKFHSIGIVDSIMYPNTISFKRFQYPSSLPIKIQKRIEAIAEKFIKGIKFDNSFFNIEFMYDSNSDKISIIEINPRSAIQFSDLYEKVDGTNSYEIMLAVATNSRLPKIEKNSGEFNYAASFAFRVFKDYEILKIPSKKNLEKIKQKFPDTRIQINAQTGKKLSDELQDGKSYLYAIINIGGKNKKNLFKRCRECKKELSFKFKSV